MITQSIVIIDEKIINEIKLKLKVGTQKKYLSGTIDFSRKYKNVEMLKVTKRKKSRSWYSEMKTGR